MPIANSTKNSALHTNPKLRRALDAGAKFVQRYRFAPNLFTHEVLQRPLDPWQLEANDKVADYVRWMYRRPMLLTEGEPKNYFTQRAMHGPGKTFWIAQLACWFGSVFPFARIPVIAPRFEQITTRVWLEIRKCRSEAHPDFKRMTKDIGAAYMRWDAGDPDAQEWMAFGQTASKAENLAGLHSDYQMVLVDEASGVHEFLYPTIFGALSTGKIQILVLIGNPTKNIGTFAESHLRPSVADQFCRMHVDIAKAPRVNKKWVARMIAKYGKDSPVVKIRCLGEFAQMGELQLISPEWLVAARERGTSMVGDGSVPRIRVSVDVADGGADKPIITVGKHWQTQRLMMKQRSMSVEPGRATAVIGDEAIRMFNNYGGTIKNGDDFVVDSLGVGAGVHDYLVRKGYSVVRYIGGGASANPARWRCRRVQSYLAWRDELRDGLIGYHPEFLDRSEAESEEIDPWDEFDAQACSIKLNPNTERVEDLQTRQQMKADGLESPDRADSNAMQYSTTAPTLSTAGVKAEPGTIEQNTVVVHTHDHWKDMFQEPAR